ncbi:hypothetical protein TTHERM_00947570 (macronuclear) [Tetrahymena thermophila SB210]|uniref:Uncharacterized protein n=1 Tax=Tetrahymena thermophila (strain SB210) TaxID=312017 RepID=I7MCD7_TETTS|nr:hypothetical protein TTHERM_00947570 [Tetrahymena thermophila SB210]EAR83330.2 hypothetical protein TTHERM_00947570 [Tetrahymena thermophila SB210]|eukprot:XP_001030993.2 hypothetical protein TTHERM_00947570 [Tetrahymena thermophila SB210]
MYFNTPSNTYYQQSAYYAPQQVLSSFQDVPQAFPTVERNFYSIEDNNHSLQQLQQDGEDLFFNQQELPNHIEDSYFGSHISYDHIHDQDDEDFHGFFPIELNNQTSQQLIWNPPAQQQQTSQNYQNVYNNNNSQKVNSSSSVVPNVPSIQLAVSASQNYQFNNIQLQNNIYSQQQQQQQKQYQNYQQQQQQSQQIGNAGVASTVQVFTNSYSGNSNQVSQQFQHSSSSSSTFSSQSCSTLFSQQKSVQYVAPSPVNYYKLYENNNLVNQQNQVKGNNGNSRQNVQQTSSYMTYQQGQSKSMFQANKYQTQQQTLYENQNYCQQQQIPLFNQQLSSEECSYGDQHASSILNFTENGCDETTSDMHFNDDHHTLPIYGYANQQCNNVDNLDFFGHPKEEEQEQVIQNYQAEIKQEQPIQQFQQVNQDNKLQQMSSNIPSISSSHTLPISPCEELKHCSEDEEHDFSHHSDQHDDEDEAELSTNNKVSTMNILPENPEFYSQQRKEQVTEAMQKSNKKNVVRNLMRAFKQYFLNRKTSDQIVKLFFPNQNAKDVQQKFKRYFSQRKFNHNSIKQLVQHDKYGVVFHQFLKEHSQSYLQKSSVKMQELHQVFIDFLLLCFKDIDLLDNLETYSKIKNPFQ